MCEADCQGVGCPSEARVDASTTQVPLFALFAPEALRYFGAANSNNAKGGTMHAEARRANYRRSPRLFRLVVLPPNFFDIYLGFGETHIETLHRFGHDFSDHQIAGPFAVGWDDEPWCDVGTAF